MRTQQTVCAYLLSTVICFGQCASARTQSDEDASSCSDSVVKQVGKHFGLTTLSDPASATYPRVAHGERLVAGVCELWPTNNSRTIAAFAYDVGTEYEKVLFLAVVEGPTNRVIAAYKGVIQEDAPTEVSSYSLKLDTARYTLSKTTRAFGLRLSTFHDRCTFEGGFDDYLTLFVVDGQTIRPVLTETMSHWSYGSGNRCGGEDVPRTDANIVISVEPTISNGFADLRLTAKRSDKKNPLSAIVRYDGERYDLKPWSAAFNAWWY